MIRASDDMLDTTCTDKDEAGSAEACATAVMEIDHYGPTAAPIRARSRQVNEKADEAARRAGDESMTCYSVVEKVR